MTASASEQYATEGKPSGFIWLIFALSLLAVLLFVLSGYGYQWEIWSLGTGFTILRYSAYVSIGMVVVNLASFFFFRKKITRPGFRLIMTGLVLTLAVTGTAYYWQGEAQKYPSIHDITTDIDNPPQFDQVIPLRADAPNPPEYAGDETAEIQQREYPDLGPLYIDQELQVVFDLAVGLVQARRWNLVNANPEAGIIEATEKLAWFGFKDDVVIRLTSEPDGKTRVDMRSKSRIGRGDIGVNAHRIRKFLEDLEKRVES